MKALYIHGKKDIRVEDVPTPEPGAGEVRLRMAYGGICGSDMHYYFEGANGDFVVREPLIPGHEMSAIVDSDPSGTYSPGTAVTLHPATFGPDKEGMEELPHLRPGGAYLGSASTWPHTQGGMSEYMLVRLDQIRVLPDSLPLDRAALAEPLAVALHAINRAGGVEGKDILVAGSGPIGLMLIFGARSLGARSIVAADVLPGPLSRARAMGATSTVQVGTDEYPVNAVDIAFECSGVPASVGSAIGAVKPGGTLTQVGMFPGKPIEVLLSGYISKEITMIGTFRFKDEVDLAIQLLDADPSVAAAITHVISADDAVAAFDIAKDSEISGKVLVDLWNQADS